MKTVLALAALAASPFVAVGTVDASQTRTDLTSEVSVIEKKCPRGEIAVTNEDGSVSCAKLTIVDPNAPGF